MELKFVFLIRENRIKKGLSLDELSQKTGISKSYLSELENNKKDNPSLEAVYKIAKVLHIEIEKISFATSELEELKNKLGNYMIKYGSQDDRTQEVSHIVDLMINLVNWDK